MRFQLPILLVLALGIQAVALAQEPASDAALPGRLLVKLRIDPPSAEIIERSILADLDRRFGIVEISPWLDTSLLTSSPRLVYKYTPNDISGESSLRRIIVVRYSADVAPEIVARHATTLDGIEYAEPVYRRSLLTLPNDPLILNQSYLDQVRAPEGWALEQADSDVVIAIVDTGIDPLHPDLRDALWTNPGESGEDDAGGDRRTNGVDDDRNGAVDDWRGYDFAGRDGRSPDNDPRPGHWHGTHVAGIAAATGDNGVGVTGIGWGARLMPLKIADDTPDGSPGLAGGFDAILYASKMHARVINCSWGGPGRSRAEQEVIDLATSRGSLVVASAGNDGDRAELYPASYRGVLSVASVMRNDRRSIFSNFNTMVGIAAPGEAIYSTMPMSAGSYGSSSGTSMSAPIVSGAAALVASRYPELGPEAVAAVLRAGSDNIDKSNSSYRAMLGTGRLNIERSLRTGPDAIHIDVLSAEALDANDDGLIDPLENVQITVELRNILRATSDLAVAIAPYDPEAKIEIISPADRLGVVGSGESVTTHTGTLLFRAPEDIPFDYLLPVLITVSDGDTPVGSIVLDLTINPNYATISNRIVTATFTGNGRVGYNDFPRNIQGEGFRVDSSDNLLAEAGLLIGIGRGRIIDVVRSSESGRQGAGLHTVMPYRWAVSDSSGAAIGTARFDDAHLNDLQRLGIDVTMTTYALPGPRAGNQVIVLYTIANRSTRRFDSLFAALYLDWDIGSMGLDNQATLDGSRRLGQVTNRKRSGLPVVGTMLLSEQPMNFMAMDNAREPLRNGFLPNEKWDAISRGIMREQSEIGDCSITIGAGPIALDPGRDTVIAFSLLGAESSAELEAAAEEGREIYRRLGHTPGGPLVLPRELVMIATPNPFESRFDISFSLPIEGPVLVDIHNALGERVALLAEGRFPRGNYTLPFEATGSSDGVFFVRLITAQGTMISKLVRIAAQ
jgi:serine protease